MNARQLDALTDRLCSRMGVSREIGTVVVAQEAQRIRKSRLPMCRSTRVAHAAARRLRQLRLEAEIEHETVPPEPAHRPDQAAIGAWRRDSWME